MKYLLALFFLGIFVSSFANGNNTKLQHASLEAKVTAIAKKYHCQVGITAIHIETNKKFAVNGQKHFFMASTVKVPIAIALLKKVDQGREHLDRSVTFNEENCVPGSGRLHAELSQCPHTMTLSLKELMRLMLVASDNTATDIILQEIKGPSTVSRYIQSLGFTHILIHRSILDLYLSASGLNKATVKDVPHRNSLITMLEHVSPAKKINALKRFQAELKDSATSDDMAQLLADLYRGRYLSPTNTRLLLKIMEQCQTGNQRIRGLLPPTIAVAHKTGTWSLTKERYIKYPGSKQIFHFTNDIGIITLPNNKGHLAIACFVKSHSVAESQRTHAIAQATKEIYSTYLKHSNFN